MIARIALWLVCCGPWLFLAGGQSKAPCPALFEAVQKGDLKQVLALLDKGADVNCRGAYNYTPLITAARYNREEIIRALCDRGAELDAVASAAELDGESGYSALLWAASNCNLMVAELLIERGAAVGRPGVEGDTALMIAARSGCLPLVGLFIDKGAVVDKVREYDKATALIEAVGRGHLDVADYLINHGANLKTKDDGGTPLLSLAAASGQYAEVRYFLEKGLPVNGKDKTGGTAIFYALKGGIEYGYILEYLIEHGGDLTIKSDLGESPLMSASLGGLSWQTAYLIEKGCAVNETDFEKLTPLHYACRGIPEEPQSSFRGKNPEATIRLLLDKDANVNALDINGKSPLMIAAHNNAPKVISLLLDRGALVNTQDLKGWTALMCAADTNRVAVIKILAARGADLNLRNAKGETPLAITKDSRYRAEAYALLKSLGAKE